MDYAETGSIGLLWISATNPAVSMPESARIRRILAGDQCFVVVQDLFLTETAELADVVLPAAGWGEKTGCFTNVNRTVHLSEQAVEPPGEARTDLDIFLAYADAMGFTDRDGAPLLRVAHARGGVRRLAGGDPGPPGRLHGAVVRQAPRTLRHPVAGQRRAPRRHRPAVRRRRLPDRHRRVRDLRARPPHRRRRDRAGAPGAGPGGSRLPQGRGVPPARTRSRPRTTRCATPPAARSYQFHTRTKTGRARVAAAGRARRLGGALPRRRRAARHHRGRLGPGRVAARSHRGRAPGSGG